MKYLFVLLLVPVFLASSVSADEPIPVGYDRMIIYDIPNAQLMAQYGRLPGQDYGGEPDYPDECPDWICYNGDSLRLLVILLEWNDRPHTYPPETIDSLFFSHDYWPGGSVVEYFQEVTFGQLTITGNCVGWFNVGDYEWAPPIKWYDEVLAELDPYIDYSQYDGNGDGTVDAICYLLAGSSYIYSEDANDMSPAAWGKAPGDELGPFDGVLAAKCNCSPETQPLRNPDNPNEFTGEDTVSSIVIECHELTHNLGANDLYDPNSLEDDFITPDDGSDYPMVDWCIMDGSQKRNAFEIDMPAHHCGWVRMKLEWMEADTLDGVYEDLVIYNIESHKDSSLYMVPIDLSKGEYFLLEFRNPYGDHQFGKYATDFSAYLYPLLDYGEELFDRGLLITHVIDSVTDHPWYAVGLPNTGPPTYDQYVVSVVDAGYDPDRDYTYNPGGDVFDGAQWWYPYECRLGACFSHDVPGQEEFGSDTYPSSDGYYGSTGIYVRVDSIVGDRLYMYVKTKDEVTYVCGDADGDGVITEADIVYLVDYLHNDGPAPYPLESGDADGDGDIDKKDANYLSNYLLKDGPAPVCP